MLGARVAGRGRGKQGREESLVLGEIRVTWSCVKKRRRSTGPGPGKRRGPERGRVRTAWRCIGGEEGARLFCRSRALGEQAG